MQNKEIKFRVESDADFMKSLVLAGIIQLRKEGMNVTCLNSRGF